MGLVFFPEPLITSWFFQHVNYEESHLPRGWERGHMLIVLL